jgi:Ca2+/Na+ antiporter
LNKNDDEAQLLSPKLKLNKLVGNNSLFLILLQLKNLDDENNQDNKKQVGELGGNFFIRTLELFAKLIRGIYYYILPGVEKYPFICFVLTLVIAFFHSKFIVNLVEDVSERTGISASFFGITLISWAGNVGDSINASTATKAQKVDLLTTGILASQIMNLQLCLGLPWIFAMINKKIENKGQMVIDFGKENVIKLFLPLLFVVCMSVFIIIIFSRVLNRKSGFCLMMIYVVYFVYESIHSKKAE